MSNKIFILTFLFFLIFNGLLIAQEKNADGLSIGLQEAWDRADEYSRELQLKQIESQVGKEQVKDAKRNWFPKIEAEATYGKLTNIPQFVNGILEKPEYYGIEDHTTYDVGVNAYFNLYNGKKVKLSVDKAQTKESMLSFITEATTSQIHYEVAEHYLDILQSNEFKRIIEQNINHNTKRLKQITQLYDNGVVLKSDLLRAQLQLSQQKINLQKMENNVEIATQKLNMLLGYDDDAPLVLTDSISFLVEDSGQKYSDYVGQTMEISPLEKIAESQITLSKLEAREVRAEKLPKIGLFGGYAYSYPQVKLYPYEGAPYLLGEYGIKISYNLSSLYTNKHKQAAKQLEVQKQIVAKDNTEEVLRSKIKTAYKRFLEDQDNIEVGKINIQQAEENYRIVNQTYFNKLALITDLLEADTELLTAQFEMVNYYISARLHYYQLLKITGQL